MDRFFTKLNLRDIKIDPFSTSFPPDADDAEEAPAEEQTDQSVPPQDTITTAPDRGDEPRPPVWSTAAPASVVEPATPTPATNGFTIHDAEREVHAPAPVGDPNGDILKVSARSRPSAVAGAIAGVVRESGRAEVQAIGAGATNQAVKAVAIARDYLRETGIEAVCLPAFIDITIDNEDRTAIRLVVEPR